VEEVVLVEVEQDLWVERSLRTVVVSLFRGIEILEEFYDLAWGVISEL